MPLSRPPRRFRGQTPASGGLPIQRQSHAQGIRLFRDTVPGPDTDFAVLIIEYENLAAYGAPTDYENANTRLAGAVGAKSDSPMHSCLCNCCEP
jgi:hypothetical protein